MNKGKQAIRKNSVKKQRPNRIKKTVRHGNRKKRRRISARANNSLTTVPQPTHMIEELILSYRNNFSLRSLKLAAGGALFIINSYIHLRKSLRKNYVQYVILKGITLNIVGQNLTLVVTLSNFSAEPFLNFFVSRRKLNVNYNTHESAFTSTL